MYLYQLFDIPLYLEMKLQGYVRENYHPHHDLSILNYTEKAQYEGLWNEVTTQCRGLIINSHDKVIARPFDKFLNYGQNPDDINLMDNQVIITDKMDGSLGILWNYDGDQGIATRGSFTSDQAIHATAMWGEKYGFPIGPDWTYLFEIIYPENRIVLDYQGQDDLVLLGVRSIEYGDVLLPNDVVTWRGSRATTFPYETLREALEAPQRPNAEGFVAYFPGLNYRIKIKQEDYIALHKIVTGLTERRVWENMKEGKTLEDLLEIVPDEWHEWLVKTYSDIRRAYVLLNDDVVKEYNLVTMWLDADNYGAWSRKDFALKAKETNYAGLLFRILDGHTISDKLWDMVRPTPE